MATPNIVPRADSEGGIGTSSKYWASAYIDTITTTSHIVMPDNALLKIGTGTDLTLQHNGSNSYIQAGGAGNLYIMQNTDDADLILACDDGSGSTTAYLTLDGSQGFTTLQKAIRAEDKVNIQAGTSGDLRIYHNGSNSIVQNVTGNLTIENTVDDGDIILQSDDGSGGVTAYLTLDGSETTVNVAKKLIVDTGSDNLIAEFKSSGDSIGEIRIADSAKYTR